MTIGGGIAGIAVGVLLSRLTISVAVGIGFGLYPAITAARLIPMDALRRE
jgi:hypothetical protein